MRSKCSQKRGLPCRPMPVNHLPTKEGETKEAKEVRVDSAWGPCASSPLGPEALHTTPAAPHLCPTSTHPVPSSWLSLSPYTSAYIPSCTYALPPNIHAWWFAGQRFTPINFQFWVGGLTIQRLHPSFIKFQLLCYCLIDNCNMLGNEIQSMFVCMFVLECIFRDVQRRGLPTMPSVALPNRAIGGKSQAIRLLAKSCLGWARAKVRFDHHAQRNNHCQPRKERTSWLNCFAKKQALC